MVGAGRRAGKVSLTYMLCTGIWSGAVCTVFLLTNAFMAVRSEHSFPGDHNNVLPPEVVLLLYSLSLQMTVPSNQFLKSGSSSNSPLMVNEDPV